CLLAEVRGWRCARPLAEARGSDGSHDRAWRFGLRQLLQLGAVARKESTMYYKVSVIALAIGGLIGCSPAKAPEVASNIRNSLNHAGLKDVSVKQDRDKGVVTLGGTVPRAAEKDRAEQIAKSVAAGQVVADESD